MHGTRKTVKKPAFLDASHILSLEDTKFLVEHSALVISILFQHVKPVDLALIESSRSSRATKTLSF